MSQRDQETQYEGKQQTSRETVSHAGTSPPTIANYDQGCRALKTMLEHRDVDPVSIWQTLLPTIENLIDGRAEQIMLSFDHGVGAFKTQVSASSSRQSR